MCDDCIEGRLLRVKTKHIQSLLSRPDKWYLGGANRLLWAPPFPLWLEYPGFWDKAHYYNLELEPVFTWTLLDDSGKEIHLRQRKREWNPAALRSEFVDSPSGRSDAKSPKPSLIIEETKSCLPNDVLTSSISVRNSSSKRRRLHLVVWTTQATAPTKCMNWISDVRYENGKIHFRRNIASESRPRIQIDCVLGVSHAPKSFAVQPSEGNQQQPHWTFTPFAESFTRKGLSGDVSATGLNDDGLLFMALHVPLTLGPRASKRIAVYFTAAPTGVEASSNYFFVRSQIRPETASVKAWQDHFSAVPYFECSDEYLTRYYWYRWYGLKLLTMQGPDRNYRHPAVCEGIGYFRAPISYSAMCHIYETRWMHSPELAKGIFRTFLSNQREDGGMRGYIDPDYYRQEMFYHANWGRALRGLLVLHPDRKFLEEVHSGLARYAEYFDRERDEERSGLYDIDNHYETGQEYMHRYTAVDPSADQENWGEVFRLKGVDVTTYLYELKLALAHVAKELGRGAEEKVWKAGAEQIRRAMLASMWDESEEMFFDVDPSTGNRTGVKAATCFYPYFTDIVDATFTRGLKRHLFNRREFASPFPFPSTSMDDPTFSATPVWKGKRMNCPWNGRVWPMTNSHLADALAETALRSRDPILMKETARFIHSYVRMMFHEGDPRRPDSFEHYNPMTGTPSVYRGIDDYQHSWVVDLILRLVAGIGPFPGGVIIDPFPFDIDEVTVKNVLIDGRIFDVSRKGGRIEVRVDGGKAQTGKVGTPLTFKR
jgi:hypothetical protein